MLKKAAGRYSILKGIFKYNEQQINYMIVNKDELK